MYVKIGYPDARVEHDILTLARREAMAASVSSEEITKGPSPLPQKTLFAARKEVLKVHTSEALENYLVHTLKTFGWT